MPADMIFSPEFNSLILCTSRLLNTLFQGNSIPKIAVNTLSFPAVKQGIIHNNYRITGVKTGIYQLLQETNILAYLEHLLRMLAVSGEFQLNRIFQSMVRRKNREVYLFLFEAAF